MKKVFQTLIVLTVLCLLSTSVSAEDYATFGSFYERFSFWEKVGIYTGIGTLIGVIILEPVSLIWLVPAAVKSGAPAIIAGLLTFSVPDTAVNTADIAFEQWNDSHFIEANAGMNTLPVPIYNDGGIAYRTAINYLKENLVKDEMGNINSAKASCVPMDETWYIMAYIKKHIDDKNKNINVNIADPKNQHILKRAGEILSEKMVSETKEKYILKDTVLLSLIYLQTNRVQQAYETAQKAVKLAGEIKEDATLPHFIMALATLASPEKECTEDTMQSLRIAYYREGSNKLIPFMTNSCLGRMMYRYHFGKLDVNFLSKFLGVITNEQHVDKECAAASLELFIMNSLAELKVTQQNIYITAQNKKAMQDENMVKELKKRYEQHKALLALLQQEALPCLVKLEDKFPKDSKLTVSALTNLLSAYWKDLPNLNQKINNK